MIAGKGNGFTGRLLTARGVCAILGARRSAVSAISLLVLSACTVPGGGISDERSGFLQELPEGVLAIAAPYQNLGAVVLRPEDGCYWYEHAGPVETTMLPLRSLQGRPICTETDDRPATTG